MYPPFSTDKLIDVMIVYCVNTGLLTTCVSASNLVRTSSLSTLQYLCCLYYNFGEPDASLSLKTSSALTMAQSEVVSNTYWDTMFYFLISKCECASPSARCARLNPRP